jgi:hypothetical protein
LSLATWSILFADGSVKKGRGIKPPPGWFNDVKRCVGLALKLTGNIPVFAVRPVCSNDVDRKVGSCGGTETARYWGLKPEPGSQVWIFPRGDLLGLGRDVCEVERLVLAFQGKVKAEKVAGGPDQRGQSE